MNDEPIDLGLDPCRQRASEATPLRMQLVEGLERVEGRGGLPEPAVQRVIRKSGAVEARCVLLEEELALAIDGVSDGPRVHTILLKDEDVEAK